MLLDGNIIQGWTLSALRTGSDVIPYPVAGTLWDVTATDEAIQGSATPIVSNVNARARSGQMYRVLFGVATRRVLPGDPRSGAEDHWQGLFRRDGPSTPRRCVKQSRPGARAGPSGRRPRVVKRRPRLRPRSSAASIRGSHTGRITSGRQPGHGAAHGLSANAAVRSSRRAPELAPAEGAPILASTATTPVPAGSQGTPRRPGRRFRPDLHTDTTATRGLTTTRSACRKLAPARLIGPH